jgi:hypothetical protein
LTAPRLVWFVTLGWFPFTVFGTYLRSLAGAVPLLDIPTTLEWKPAPVAERE